MKFRFPQFQSCVALLSVSFTMVMIGAGIATYGSVIAHDFPISILKNPFFAVSLLLFGLGGIIFYLFTALFSESIEGKFLRFLVASPFILYAVIFSLSGSPIIIAWSVPTTVIVIYGIMHREISDAKGLVSILGPYAFSILILFGGITLLFREPLEHLTLAFSYPLALLIGLAGILALIGGYHRVETLLKIISGVFFLWITILFVLFGAPLMHAILTAPIGFALLAEGFLKRMRLGQSFTPGMSSETLRIIRFQDVTEVNAWAVAAFALVYVFISPEFGGDIIFFLFGLSFILWVYQYRYKDLKKETFKGYSRNSFKNLVLLSVVAHFLGGFHSPFIWFFPVLILSAVVTANKRHIYVKIAYITGYLLFEGLLVFYRGQAGFSEIFQSYLLLYFILIITASYIYRTADLQKKIDKGLKKANSDLSSVLEREREAKSIISSQAVELRQAQEQLEKIITSVADGIVAIDADGAVVFMNEAAQNLLFLAGTATNSEMFSELLPFLNENPDTPDISTVIKSVLFGSEEREVESYGTSEEGDERVFLLLPEGTYLKLKTGKKAYLEGAIVDLGVGAGNVRIVITFRDITYRREIDQMKTDFMSVAAHQLRTPLSSIRWFLELLNDPSEGKLKKNQKMFAENAYTSLLRMISLVNGLLAVTRVESLRVPSKPEPLLIPSLTKNIIDEAVPEVKKKKLKIHVNVDGKIPEIKLDPQLSREVFKNLIDNAIRYSEEKGEILISIIDEKDAVHWIIRDNGIGIPKEQQARIFEKFYRASNATSYESKGTGLGLYLAKFIVGQWSGKIWFDSKEGEGTTFHVTIPHVGMKERKGEVSLHA